ncbi:MAG TPA: decarboxylating 6-phosphogluconate dehydrogenase [Thermodesulfovibrionales bacterium]|nr:decarboxylating 6-phosphogluconate dehydrogenase [Thermodesulfobacteriota bacterium]HZV47887.1 decarboxylating 6-phosphogluconate dehydrogenase [Thermodesulfovibrionales bacterium]
MKIGYVGLGKMGFNIVERLLDKKHEVFVFDKNEEAVKNISAKGSLPAGSLQSLISALTPPRLIWVMVPYQAVDTVLQELLPFLQRGDTVIDGGNSPYKESIRRFKELNEREINYLDVGVSGGPSGARNGACIMVGGKKEIFRKYKNLFRDLACKGGYAYMGKPGAGHFVKMVHNGIEYGMMQALAEGFAVMKASPFAFDLTKTARLYNHKSVIESRLVGWLQKAFDQHGENLDEISGTVSHSGEGSWTVEAAKELGTSVPVIEGSLNFRIQSQANPSYTGQILSAVRNQFGGHEVFKKTS